MYQINTACLVAIKPLFSFFGSSSIQVGNVLHKTAVISAIGSLFMMFIPRGVGLDAQGSLKLATTSAACSGLYWMLMRGDLLSQYQVDRDGEAAGQLPTLALSPGVKYVVLQRRNDSARKFVQTSLSSLAMWYCYRRQPEVFQARISTLVTITEQTATVVRAGVTKALAASTGLLAVAESALAEVKLWLLS